MRTYCHLRLIFLKIANINIVVHVASWLIFCVFIKVFYDTDWISHTITTSVTLPIVIISLIAGFLYEIFRTIIFKSPNVLAASKRFNMVSLLCIIGLFVFGHISKSVFQSNIIFLFLSLGVVSYRNGAIIAEVVFAGAEKGIRPNAINLSGDDS